MASGRMWKLSSSTTLTTSVTLCSINTKLTANEINNAYGNFDWVYVMKICYAWNGKWVVWWSGSSTTIVSYMSALCLRKRNTQLKYTQSETVALIKKCLDPFYSTYPHSLSVFMRRMSRTISGMTIPKKRTEKRREIKWVQRVHFIVGIWGRQAFWTLPHVLWRIKSAYKRKMCKICQHRHTHSLSFSRSLCLY